MMIPPHTIPPRGHWFERNPKKTYALAACLGLLVLLASLECLTRAFFPRINFLDTSSNLFLPKVYGKSYANARSVVASSFGAKVYTDSHGFRIDPHYNYRAKQGLPVIVLLGDSVFFGPGVPAKRTFAELLNRRLTEYRFINTAVIGYNISDYKNFLDYSILTHQDKEKISRVILGLCLNDLESVSNTNIINNSAGKPSLSSPLIWLGKIKSWDFGLNNFLKSYSKFFLLIKSGILDSSKMYFQYDAQQYHIPENVAHLVTELDYLKNTLQENHIPFTVIILPYEYQLREQNQENEYPIAVLRNSLAAHGIDYRDGYAYFAREMQQRHLHSQELYLFNDPMHFSATGHRLLYQLLTQTVMHH
jgi:lysophospholipase L1-like esterase